MRNKLVISLEELLSQHDCVAVAGLGAFIQEHIPATCNGEHRLVYPPRVALRFNEALQHQDGLLLEYYASTLGISQRRAKLEIEQDVRQLRQLLLKQQYVDLQGIGTLRLSPEGRLSFTSKVSEKINHRYYGLQAVISPLREPQKEDVTEVEQPEVSTNDYIQVSIPKSLLRYVAAAVVASLLLIVPFSIWPERQQNYQASFVPDKTVVAKIIEPITTSNEVIAPPTTEKTLSPIVEAEAGRYYVIIGSERKLAIAERYIERYQGEYPKLCILQGRNVLRISVEDFASAQEAQMAVNTLSKKGISAWVYHL